MSQRREGPRLGQFVGNAEIGMNLRVKRTAGDAGIVEVAGDELSLGTTMNICRGAGKTVTVYQNGAPGTNIYVADGVIAKGAAVYGAAAGQVSASVGTEQLGVAEHATASAGELIEVGPA